MGLGDDWANPPKQPRSPADSGNNGTCGCDCPMIRAVRSVKQRQFGKAARYARLGIRAMASRAFG